MTFMNHSLFLILAALAVTLLLFQVFQPGRDDTSTAGYLLRLVKEEQRKETLSCIDMQTKEAWTALQSIVHKLIAGELTLENALDAYAEVYNQLYFMRKWMAEGKVRPLSQEKAFESLVRRVQNELANQPSRSWEVTQRLRKEWQSLHASQDKVS